ncbi:hypothetical protein A9Q81_04935 [Gammaproteobacteria bacterium 42_54_T18]|nr:hypothetical protein A9Q81_04935 [Gammaproteobacteria bacterium 42_54_T18]
MYKSFITFISISALATLSLTGCMNLRTGPQLQETNTVDTAPPSTTDLEEAIQRDIANWRLSSPKDNNAAEKLVILKELNPTNIEILRIESQIAQRYIQLANKALAKQKVPSRTTLNKALSYIKKARTITPTSTLLNKKEKQINELISINTKKKRLQEAKAKAKKKKLAEQKKRDAKLALEAEKAKQTAMENELINSANNMALDANNPPSSLAMRKPVANTPASSDDLLMFKQVDVDNQSLTLGLELENLSRRIVNRNAGVIVHANSEEDFRWINGSLKTYIYLLDSNFHLNSTSKIGPQEHPSIELIQ